GTPPHKDLPTETPPPYIRFTMTENAFSDVKKAIVSDIEIYNSESSNYTIDTIHKINKDYPNSELFLLVGNDMYDSLDTWKDSKELKKLVTPVLLPREKVKISSTEIRDLLPKRKGNEYISKDNYALIIKHRYYKAKPNFKWLREEAHSMLDTKRIPHVDATEEVAVRLASFWNVNKDDAGEAAILHDITKRLDFEQNMCIITSYGLISSDYSRTEEKIIHAITGAIIAKTKFGVSDDVANAIRRHTTGCRGMTTLDKIIYIADYIEATREMPQIEDLRKLAFENLNKAVVMGLEMSVNDLLSRDIIPNAATYDALDNLRRDIHETVRRQE
ncbi:MAG: bis(5'-nucleosyl)-tetraphosphatase (symmetrical) YqeK, partial [Oscillospiraceae bacterium]|nr:bis(5'-nucleosyl)-tetraphosphatase (symmetrical) YqeK [Oscillospiraceae bacterium]